MYMNINYINIIILLYLKNIINFKEFIVINYYLATQ